VGRPQGPTVSVRMTPAQETPLTVCKSVSLPLSLSLCISMYLCRWGRGQEVPGEDPYLTGRYAVAFVSGLQGHPSDPYYDPAHPKLVATCKHFAAYSVEDGEGTDALLHPCIHSYAHTYSHTHTHRHIQTQTQTQTQTDTHRHIGTRARSPGPSCTRLLGPGAAVCLCVLAPLCACGCGGRGRRVQSAHV
jgi:hypothetical protein